MFQIADPLVTTQLPKIVAVQSIAQLTGVLVSDVKWYEHNKHMVQDPPDFRFVLLSHKSEYPEIEQTLVTAMQRFVIYNDIALGVPALANYNLYVTDLSALGLNKELISNLDFVNTTVRFAKKIVYIG